MNTKIQKERNEMMIHREYADLPAEIRNQMIASEWKGIDERAAYERRWRSAINEYWTNNKIERD